MLDCDRDIMVKRKMSIETAPGCRSTHIPIPSWTHAQAHVNLDQSQPKLVVPVDPDPLP